MLNRYIARTEKEVVLRLCWLRGYIEISIVVAVTNEAYRLYKEEFRPKNFYRRLVAQGHGRASDCVACGQCEDVCPQHLPIIELLKEAAEAFDEAK